MLNQQHQLPTKTARSKKFFLKMLPRIHTQSEETLRKTQSYTTTTRSTYSQKPSPRFESRKQSSYCIDVVTPISDYFDPVQIHSAISKTNNVIDRIKVLDHVLQKRNTIVESEKQNQMERIAPMVKNFVGAFRIKDKARIQTPKVNKFRNSLRKVNFDQDPSSDSFLTSPELVLSARFHTEQDNFDEDHFTSPARKLSTVDCSSPMFWKPLHTHGSANQSLTSSSLLPKEKQINSIPAEPARAQSESKVTPPSSQRRNGFITQFSKEMIVGTFKSLMKQKLQNTHENFSSFRPDPTKKQKRLTIVIKKKDDPQAKKRLEQDILKFLIKNGEAGRDALQTTRARKDSKIKNIETRALLHFDKYQEHQQAFKEDQRRSSHQKPLQTQPDRFKLHK